MDLPHLLCTVEAGLQIPRDDEGSRHVVSEDVVEEEEGQPLGLRLVVHLRREHDGDGDGDGEEWVRADGKALMTTIPLL